MRGMIETEWAAFETKSLPDLVERRKEAESDSDSDSDCYKYCTQAEPNINSIPRNINMIKVETVNEQDDSDTGSLPGLQERIREETDSESDSDDEKHEDSDACSLPGLQDRNREDSDSDDSTSECDKVRRTQYNTTQ